MNNWAPVLVLLELCPERSSKRSLCKHLCASVDLCMHGCLFMLHIPVSLSLCLYLSAYLQVTPKLCQTECVWVCVCTIFLGLACQPSVAWMKWLQLNVFFFHSFSLLKVSSVRLPDRVFTVLPVLVGSSSIFTAPPVCTSPSAPLLSSDDPQTQKSWVNRSPHLPTCQATSCGVSWHEVRCCRSTMNIRCIPQCTA